MVIERFGCGCAMRTGGDTAAGLPWSFGYCPLHEAAPALRDALEAGLKLNFFKPAALGRLPESAALRFCELAEAAIAQARSGLPVKAEPVSREYGVDVGIQLTREVFAHNDMPQAVSFKFQELAAIIAYGIQRAVNGPDELPAGVLPRPGAICRNCNADAVVEVDHWLYCSAHIPASGEAL